MIDCGLKGKVVVVTGGNNPRGIGAATARAFAAQGADVFVHYLRQLDQPGAEQAKEDHAEQPGLAHFYSLQAETADEVVREARRQGINATSWEADLADPAVVPELFDRAEKELGPVNVVVNNAADYQADTFLPSQSLDEGGSALWADGPLTNTVSTATSDRHFAVNTRAVALMMAEFARRHIKRGERWGRIVNVSADCAWGCPAEISYRASKYALESYSRSAAAELGPYGITVNTVAPGPVQTGYIAPEFEKELIADIPLRRVGRPEDIADVIVFLASDQAGWVTGQLLLVLGGHRMSLGL